MEGMKVDGCFLIFSEVMFDEFGWFVFYLFEDGVLQGKIYVGVKYLVVGMYENVIIDVIIVLELMKGINFIVMLYSDVDGDEIFDFVFVDECNVVDQVVFEGLMMIGYVVSIF